MLRRKNKHCQLITCKKTIYLQTKKKEIEYILKSKRERKICLNSFGSLRATTTLSSSEERTETSQLTRSPTRASSPSAVQVNTTKPVIL